MANALRLVEDGPRAELADAISTLADATKAADAARRAVGIATGNIADAEAALATAGSAVTSARDVHRDRLVLAASSGQAMTPDTDVRDARAHEIAAKDDVEDARAALTALKEAVADAEYVRRRAEKRVETAVVAVFKAAPITLLLEQADAIQRDLVGRRLVLRHLVFKDLVAAQHLPAVQRFLMDTNLPGGYGSIDYGNDWSKHAATQPWLEARDALQRDATAPLPI